MSLQALLMVLRLRCIHRESHEVEQRGAFLQPVGQTAKCQHKSGLEARVISCWKKNVLTWIFKTGKFKGSRRPLREGKRTRKPAWNWWSENKTVEGLSELEYQELSKDYSW